MNFSHYMYTYDIEHSDHNIYNSNWLSKSLTIECMQECDNSFLIFAEYQYIWITWQNSQQKPFNEICLHTIGNWMLIGRLASLSGSSQSICLTKEERRKDNHDIDLCCVHTHKGVS